MFYLTPYHTEGVLYLPHYTCCDPGHDLVYLSPGQTTCSFVSPNALHHLMLLKTELTSSEDVFEVKSVENLIIRCLNISQVS